MNKIENILNFKGIRNEGSNLAYKMIKEYGEKNHKYKKIDKNDLNFELENYFYNGEDFPSINLNNFLDEDILLKNNFKKKSVNLLNEDITFYENINNPLIKIYNNKLVLEDTSLSKKIELLVSEKFFPNDLYEKCLKHFKETEERLKIKNIPSIYFFKVFDEPDNLMRYFYNFANSIESNDKIKIRNNKLVNQKLIEFLVDNFSLLEKKVYNFKMKILFTEIPVGNYFVPALLFLLDNGTEFELFDIVAIGVYRNFEDKLLTIFVEMYSEFKNKEKFQPIIEDIRKILNCVYYN